MPNYPCKNCPNRYLACHDHCEKYKAIKAQEQKYKDANRGKKEAYMYTIENSRKTHDFNVKKKREGRMTYSKKG